MKIQMKIIHLTLIFLSTLFILILARKEEPEQSLSR
jgi:hypothetical protein